MAAKLAGAETARGAYLSDGKRLFCVLDSHGSYVLLENCRFPKRPPVYWPVKDVLKELKAVRHQRQG